MPTDTQNNPVMPGGIPIPVPPSPPVNPPTPPTPLTPPTPAPLSTATPIPAAAAPGTAGLSPLQAARSNLSNLTSAGLSAANIPNSATPLAPAAPTTPTPTATPAPTPVIPAAAPISAAAPATPTTVNTAQSSITFAAPTQVSVPTTPTDPIAPTTSPAPTASAPATSTSVPTRATPAAPPIIPSVAPRAPGAEIKPTTPTSEAQPTEPAKPEKKVDLVMIILSLILIVLLAVAGYLWWMNSQGKSIFAPRTSQNKVVEPSATPTPASVSDASASSNLGSSFDETDICYVNPNQDGQQTKVTEFITWLQQSFSPIPDTDGNYAWLFDYFIDRANMTAGLCKSHQQYCHINFVATPKYAAQFTHFNQQRELEAQGQPIDYQAIVPEAELQRLMMVDFNMNTVKFSDPTMGEGTLSPNGWNYDVAAGGLKTFGAYNQVAPEYSYTFDQAYRLDATNQVVLVGKSIASANCKEANNCVCEASRIYLLLEMGNTDNLFFQDVFVEPLVGQFADVRISREEQQEYL